MATLIGLPSGSGNRPMTSDGDGVTAPAPARRMFRRRWRRRRVGLRAPIHAAKKRRSAILDIVADGKAERLPAAARKRPAPQRRRLEADQQRDQQADEKARSGRGAPSKYEDAADTTRRARCSRAAPATAGAATATAAPAGRPRNKIRRARRRSARDRRLSSPLFGGGAWTVKVGIRYSNALKTSLSCPRACPREGADRGAIRNHGVERYR